MRLRLHQRIICLLVLILSYNLYAQTGSILREYWYGINGSAVSDLTNHSNFPLNPSGSELLTEFFEGPVNWNDSYGTRIRGFVHPPVSGNYIFWISGDDNCELWLSTDDKQSNKQLIAIVEGYTESREWNKYQGQQSSAQYLEAGKRYYIEALHKEGTQSDNVAVGWQLPGSTYERPIPANRLSPVTDDDDYSLWSDTTGILMNTSESGIDISSDVLQFPVLIRLNSSNFDFSMANSDGSDIRFAKHDGTHLPYQIEHWNSDSSKAQIWVKVDTVFANDSSQYITMFWGKADAVSRSDGSTVFDTSNGFRGVWHLNQNPSGTPPQMVDASGSNNNGTIHGGMSVNNSIDAVIGKGITIDGIDDYISTQEQFGNPQEFSISLWFKTTSVEGGRIIGFGDMQIGQSNNYDRHIYMDSSGIIHFGMGYENKIISSSVPYNDGEWHHITASLSSAGMRLFIDGVRESYRYSYEPAHIWGYWKIGYDNLQGWPDSPSDYYWQGDLDEIAISYIRRNDQWIKLAYENQKIGSTFPLIESHDTKPLVFLNSLVAAVPESSSTVNAFSVTVSVGAPDALPVNMNVQLSYSGTAQSGEDYLPLPDTVSVLIPADSLSKTVKIGFTPVDDTLQEGDETVIIMLVPDSSYRIGEQNQVMITIVDDDQIYPPQITSGPSDLTLLEGETATFMVEADGSQPFNYQWRKDGLPTGNNSALYTIYSVSISDSGSAVDCIVSNSAGSDSSRQALLSVSKRPETPWILTHPQSRMVAQGDTARFSVYASGTPPLSFQWYCDDAQITGETDSVLVAGPVTLEDNGKKFYCEVSNLLASIISRDALLTVKKPSSHTVIITGDLLTTKNDRVGKQGETEVDFIVNLYSSASSGTVLYSEEFLDTNNQAIKVKDGKFSVHLGTGKTDDNLMEAIRENPNIFVSFSIAVPGGNFETMDRRVPLTASPYALSSLPQVLKGIVDPDSANIEAPIGTHFVRTNDNSTYIKTYRGWSKFNE